MVSRTRTLLGSGLLGYASAGVWLTWRVPGGPGKRRGEGSGERSAGVAADPAAGRRPRSIRFTPHCSGPGNLRSVWNRRVERANRAAQISSRRWRCAVSAKPLHRWLELALADLNGRSLP